MHTGITYTYDNINYHNEVISYYYQVKPINSLFTSNLQQSQLMKIFQDKIEKVNMPGMIIIKPKQIDNQKVINQYVYNFNKHGNPDFKDIAVDLIKDYRRDLGKVPKYRYEIFLVFTDGRDDIHKMSFRVIPKDNKPLKKQELETYQSVDKEIYSILSNGLEVSKLKENKVTALLQYLSVPVDDKIDQYYVEPTAVNLQYEYKKLGNDQYQKMYTRTLMAAKFDRTKVNPNEVDDIVNTLQLERFPTDVIVKFDLIHTKKFKREMTARKQNIKKNSNLYTSLSNQTNEEGRKAYIRAVTGESAELSKEDLKVRWQLYLRIRAESENLLETRSNRLQVKFDKKAISLSYLIGDQLKLANDLFPYRAMNHRFVQLTDMSYFARFNFFGGLYVGEEDENMILTYTRPGEIPIFYDSSLTLEGKTRTNSSVVYFAGETGSGKTQLADHMGLMNMVFKGMRNLIIDPKGDRKKKIQFLGNRAAHLEIGSADCPNGMFDPYVMNQNANEALDQAKRDIASLARALDKDIKIDFYDIVESHEEMLVDYKNGIIKRLSLTNLLTYIARKNKILSRQLKSLCNDKMARLFFADEKTEFSTTFNLNKDYNLITFAHMPLFNQKGELQQYNPNALDHAIFSVVLSRVQGIVYNFMKSFGEEENVLIVDEYRVFKSIPGGETIVDNLVMQVRSWLTHLYIISQAPSDASAQIVNNIGQYFIGSLGSAEEIDHVLKNLQLDNHGMIKQVLLDKTKSEGVSEQDKYTFLYQDYNNRKCVTKMKIPNTFKEIFKTLKEETNKEVIPHQEKERMIDFYEA